MGRDHRNHRGRGGGCRTRAPTRRRHPRRRDARTGRHRGAAPDPQLLRCLRDHADGSGRGNGSAHRAGGRRRRLPVEAIQPPRTGRQDQSRPAPTESRPSDTRCRARWQRSRHRCRAAPGPRDDAACETTALEFDLLVALAEQPGRVFSRRQLLERVWGWDYIGDERVVDVHVRNLRKALGDNATNPRWIGTVRNVGYRFVSDHG
ncbi:MAG: winged helix-turn-helix domain-containing protein [Acidimicrobiales bacterium]